MSFVLGAAVFGTGILFGIALTKSLYDQKTDKANSN